MSGPLEGVKVLDFTELLPGPFLTQSLVEMGAEVLKLERPPRGDLVRTVSPGLFGAVNRGKASLMIDLKNEAGRAEALRLAAEADVVAEGFRPGVMERLGLGYDAVRAVNPQVVYLSLSGYGQTGPMRLVPGHDVNYLANAGVTSLCGAPGEAPMHGIGLPVADLGGAIYGLSAVLAALFQRERTGEGQHLDLSLADCMAHWMNARRGVCNHSGFRDLESQRAAALTRPAYGVFHCRDGSLTIAALEGHFWKALAEELELTEFQGPEFDASAARVARCAEINAAIATRIARMSRDDAVARLLARDIPAAPVLSMDEADASPHYAARGLAAETDAGPLSPFPIRMSGMKDCPRGIPPLDDAREAQGGGA